MEDYSAQIRSFGALGYSPEHIASLLNLTGKERVELAIRLTIPDDPFFLAYQNGLAIGAWNIDAELAKQAEKGDIDSISALAERSKERKIKDLKKHLFGI
ncbi:hypothetical protein [Parabacteroides distasonis]|uniref:Uncharacterized protein n=1 Tax=Parabacteroides distasonis TaxID=823 RepID=A0A5C6K3S3_PARDI|nr:hypothetical protein [Parabacteroides distasonis]TWV57740.1 hypothetical protein FSA05_22560 [Parabacteroides distasonis]